MTPHEETKRSLLEYAAHLKAAGTPALPEDAARLGRSIEALVTIVERHDLAAAALTGKAWAALPQETREELVRLGPVLAGGLTELACLVRAALDVGALASTNPALASTLYAMRVQSQGRA
jgi:hypothetical protein